MNVTEAKKLLDGKNLTEVREEYIVTTEELINGIITDKESSERNKRTDKMFKAVRILIKDAGSRGDAKTLKDLL